MKHLQVQAQNQAPSTQDVLMTHLKSPGTLVMFGLLVFAILSSINREPTKKGQLGTSYWASKREEGTLRREGEKLVSHPKHNACSFYIGTPQGVAKKLAQEWLYQGLEDYRCRWTNAPLYVPHAQRGTMVVGASGTGKTVSVIDPCVRSILDQGFPLLLYDFKFPAQTRRIAAYAIKRGYQVHFFCPGFNDISDTCNPIDFIKDSQDGVGASQLGEIIAKNIDLDPDASGDKFFEDAGATLIQGIFLLTKAVGEEEGMKYADLMTAAALLSLPSLGKRLEQARQKGQFNVWTMRPLAQLIALTHAPETESSVVGTAQRIFAKFIQKQFIRSYCGSSTLPLDLEGKELLIMGVDRQNRDVVIPLLASVIHMVVTRNVSRSFPRTDPFCVVLDELPSMYLPQLNEWLSQNREDGFCCLAGIQNFAQLEQKYNEKIAKIIIANCSTKFIFNPQEVESAEKMAKMLGSFDVDFSTKSRSSNFGKHGGGSRSQSENKQRRDLFELSQFMKLGVGNAIVISPSSANQEESYVPFKHKFRLFEGDLAQMRWSESQWEKIYAGYAQYKIFNQITDQEWDRQFEERIELVERIFPLELDEDSVNFP